MIVSIRNASGFDLFLALSASEKGLRIRVSLDPPSDGHIEKLRRGHAFGIPACPEGLGVRLSCPKELLYVAKTRKKVDRLDDFGELDGEETYLEYTLRLVN